MAFRIPGRELPPPIKPEFQALIDRGNVTLAEYKTLRGSTRDWEALVPALDDEALAHVVEHCMNNMGPTDRVSYAGAMQNVYAPEVIKRLRARAAGPGAPPSCPHGKGFNCSACYPKDGGA